MIHRTLSHAHALSTFTSIVIAVCWWTAPTARCAAAAPTAVSLPRADTWKAESAIAKEKQGEVELELTVNYQSGRAASPTVPAKAEELFTFAADVSTEFPPSLASYYRFWLSLEFLRADAVIASVASAEIVGDQKGPELLAVTGVAPPQTTGVRVVLHAQNKYWSPRQNRAVARQVRLLKLAGKRGGDLQSQVIQPFPNSKGERVASLRIRGDWPDGTALKTATTRGDAPRAAILSQGRAEFAVAYAPEDVGSATVSTSVADEVATTIVPDPHAGTLKLTAIVADGFETPALMRLTHEGDMLPGKYQTSVPGIFVSAPYTVELAPGRWHLEICRGPQFEPHVQDVQTTSGKTALIEKVELTRRTDLRKNGWYGGDADGDVYHGERIYTDVSARTAADIAQAVGLDWVGVGSWEIKPKNWGEARAHIRSLDSPQLLFMWTDERPKTVQGHGCFLGLVGPDAETLGWVWGGLKRPMDNFEVLQAIRAHGGATFVNHPLRWWMKGERFNTNMYSSLAFDLCAAAAIDGFNLNDGEDATQVWSMLLDHGYRVAATAGADFGLDRPAGPLPGKARMYCFCPGGLSEAALSEAVRAGHTIVSTGPVLQADVDGAPPGSTVSAKQKHRIRVQAWARGDQPDPLKRLELWAHGKAVATHDLKDAPSAIHVFDWQPSGGSDWVSVRAVSQRGWAMTSAFYADGEGWHPKRPLECELTLEIDGLTPAETAKSNVEVWDRAPGLPGAKQLQQLSLSKAQKLVVPVTATIVVRAPGQRVRETNVFDALGVREIIDRIAAGEQRAQPLREWKTYQQVLDRCHNATLKVSF